MIFAIGMTIYLVSSLFIGRCIYRNNIPLGTIRFKAAMVYISPLLLLGWLQEKAKKGLDVWFEKGMK